MRRLWLPLAGLLIGACADERPVGLARFALGEAAFFRLRIFDEVPGSLADKALFDTGCLQQQSRTYELSNIPAGDGYTVVYEGFSGASCDAGSAVAFGYRGGVSISRGGDAPYFHVQVYPSGGVATLPEEINLSASVARAVEFCEGAADCGADEVCYDAAKPEYWCVPTCTSDADCRGIHVRASCETSEGWCVLRSPFPLNLSEPRAFGAATTLSDGDVLFVGGVRQDGVGTLLPSMYPLERFDAQTGLFVAASVADELPKIGGEFGFAALSADRFVTVGGFVKARLDWTGSGLELTNESSDVSADVIVWDMADGGHAKATSLARSVARAAVVRLAADRFFVAGGLVVSGPGLETTRATTLCTVSGGEATCEAGPTLVHPRQAPAATCLDEACQRVLLVGGNPGGAIAELVDLSAGTAEALSGTGLPDKLFGGVLCGLDLLAGSKELARAAPFTPLRLSLADGGLSGSVITGLDGTGYLAAVARQGDSCWVVGGIDGMNGIQSNGGRFVRSVDGSVSGLAATLGHGRFGAVAGVIGSGLLAGRLVIAGGVEIDGNGPVRVVRGAEVLSP